MSWSKTLVYSGILAVVFTLPYDFPINNIAIIYALACFLIFIMTSKQNGRYVFSRIFNDHLALVFIGFSILYLGAGLIRLDAYQDPMIMWKALEKRIPFLIFPFVLTVVPLYSKRQIKWIFHMFLIMVVLSSLTCLIIGAYQTITTGTVHYINTENGVVENNFMYYRLSSYIGIHPVYFSSYVLLATILSLSDLRQNFQSSSSTLLIFKILTLFYLIGIIFLLKSAIIITALLIILLGFLGFHFYQRRAMISGPRLALIVIGMVAVSVILAVRVDQKIGQRGSLFSYDYSQPGGGSWNVVNLRLAKWTVATEAIRNHWLAGVGPGNLYSTLDRYYKLHNFRFALREHYNPHNQFLHSFLILGILGLLLLVFMFVLPFVKSWQKLDVVWFLFSFGFILFSVTESTLAVNKGIIFYVFMTCLFNNLPSLTSTYLRNE